MPVPDGGGETLPDDAPDPADQVTEACQRRGTFTAEQIAEDTGLTLSAAQGHIGWLVKAGLVQKQGKDVYQWIGN
jgi:predicted ArsR family transcriptional regulator